MATKSSMRNRLVHHALGAASASPIRRKRRWRSALLEALETRNLLSTITWGNASGGDWNTASNWIGDQVPGAGDAAVINVAGGVTITFSSGTASVQSINSTDPIAITGGSLTLTSGSSVLSGGLTVSGGATVTATGGSTSLTASGTTNINGGNLTAAAGATVALPNLTTCLAPTASFGVATLEATGAGSILDLSSVTSLTGGTVFGSGVDIEALAGGDVKLNALTSITAQVFLKSDGSGSVLNLSELTSLSTTSDAYTSGLQCTNSGEVLDPDLATITITAPASLLSGPTMTLDGTSTISTSQITTFTGGQLNISGGDPNFSGMTDFNTSGATISAGGTLTLSALTSYQTPATSEDVVTMEATGTGSVLDLSHVTSLTGPNMFDCGTNIEALAGGDVKLNALTSITAQVFLESDGSGSVLNLSDLTTLSTTSDAYTSGLQCTNSGEVLDPDLATITITAPASLLSGPTMTLDGTSTISTSQITTFTGGQLNISGGDPNFSGMTDFNTSGATISAGGTLTLSALTSYQTPATSEDVVTLEATGSGSSLDLSHVTSLTGPNMFDCGTNIEALAGGDVKLNALTSITAQVFLESDGSGSVLNLSDLTSLSTTSDAYTSGLQCTDSGQVLDPDLTTIELTPPAQAMLSGPTMTLDGTSVISTSQITTFTGGQLNISGGTPNFSGLTNFNASGATVSGGTLTLSVLTSYQTPTTANTVVTLEATGAGSTLNLSHITSLTGPFTFDCGTDVEALAGGYVTLYGLITLNAQAFLEADGTGSILDLSNLSSITTGNNAFTSGIQASNGGEVLRVGAATKLAFSQGPVGTVGGSTLAPIIVHVEYASGQTVATDSSMVTIHVSGTYPVLNGTTNVAAQNGEATFSNLSLPLSGSYTLTATDGSLASAVSGSFNITASPNQQYVTQIYHDILNRAPDAGGLESWTQQLDNGTPLQAVALGLSSSTEYYSDVVTSYYEEYLGRAPDAGGLEHWVNLMKTGTSPELLRVDIVSSTEYYDDGGGTPVGYITELYEALLGRAPDAGGLVHWEGVLAQQGAAAVATGFIISTEWYTDVISGYYEAYLHRAADPGGLAYWLAKLQSGVTEQVIISDFTSSAEYLAVHDIA